MKALQKAVEILGSQTRLAQAIGVRQQNVWSWLNLAKKVPAEYCRAIEKATSGQISKETLRPDVFGKEKK